MSRYHTASGPEATWEPGSRNKVLKNLLGITRKTEMDRAEYEALIAAQTAYYRRLTQETRFDAALIRQMHADWLGHIYEWAGNYRTVEVSKGDFSWPPAYLIADNMARFEAHTLGIHTPCRPRNLADVCRSIAVVHAELLLIHPFREGNGRMARWIADIMAAQAGYPPPLYVFSEKGSVSVRKRYLSAVIEGYAQRYEDLSSFFEEAVRNRLEA